MRKLFALFFLFILSTASTPAFAAPVADVPTLSVQTDHRQIAVAAALVVAGYDAPPVNPAASTLRDEVRTALASIDPALKQKLETFYRTHRRTGVDEERDAARYRAVAVAINPPPSFALPGDPSQLPADVRAVLGFGALAGELYRSPQFRAILPKLLEAYGKAASNVAASVQPAIEESLVYLRTRPIERIETPAVRDEKGNLLRPAVTRLRRLKVFADPLLSGKSVVVRDDLLDAGDELFAQRVGDRYSIFAGDVVGRDDAAVWLAILRFTIEPLVDRNREVIEEETAKLDEIVARHQAAKERYAAARVALVTDSLVTALAARQLERAGKLSPNGAIDVLGVAHERGEVFAIHFYERLKRFEDAGFDLAVFYPDFIHSLSAERERTRLEQIAAARTALVMEPRTAPVTGDVFASEILEADRLITQKRFGEARPMLEKILAQSEGNARALFGLAQVLEHVPATEELDASLDDADRASAQMERLERAVNLYRRAALNASERERWLASWAHVYAGRILDFLELRDEALAEYRAAVKVGDVPQGAFREAQRGIERPFEPGGEPATAAPQ